MRCSFILKIREKRCQILALFLWNSSYVYYIHCNDYNTHALVDWGECWRLSVRNSPPRKWTRRTITFTSTTRVSLTSSPWWTCSPAKAKTTTIRQLASSSGSHIRVPILTIARRASSAHIVISALTSRRLLIYKYYIYIYISITYMHILLHTEQGKLQAAV